MKKKRILAGAILLVVFWAAIGVTDFCRVKSFERPLFCIPANIYKDGGSGHYVGLGYSFDIEGNFMPEDELPGVTKYVFYVLGTELRSGIRD